MTDRLFVMGALLRPSISSDRGSAGGEEGLAFHTCEACREHDDKEVPYIL